LFQITKLSNIGGMNIRDATWRVMQRYILVSFVYMFLDVAVFNILMLYSVPNYKVVLMKVTLKQECWCQTWH